MERESDEECPFLREERVVFCKAFPLSKVLPLEKVFDKENLCLLGWKRRYTSFVRLRRAKPETQLRTVERFGGGCGMRSGSSAGFS